MSINITIRFDTRKRANKPKLGDVRETKNGPQIRLFRYVTNSRGKIVGYDCNGGRQRYVWCDIDKVPECDRHLIPENLRATLDGER